MDLRSNEEQAIRNAIALAQQSRAPADAARNMPAIAELLTRFAPALNREGDARNLYSVPFVSPVTLTPTGMTESDSVMYWPRNGSIIGIRATILEAGENQGFGHVKLRIRDQAGTSFFRSGNAEAYVSIAALRGGRNGWFPLHQRVQTGQTWTVTARSDDALPATGTVTWTPEVVFLFEPSDQGAP